MATRAVAYCRVSTEKAAQLDSYAAQKEFFVLYCSRQGYELTCIYGDEGKSGTRMASRPELQRLLSDARRGLFDLVLVKDVSRLARNVVDFLFAIRLLKELDTPVHFVNADLSSSTGNEFILTILSAIAQEESASLSRRIKFGKQLSAQKGRVPNLVFGYRRLGLYELEPHPTQANTVKQIYFSYADQGCSMEEIARGIATGMRAEIEFSAEKGVPPVVNDPTFTERAAKAIRKAVGKDHITKTSPVAPSEDFAWYLKKVPGALMFLGVGDAEKGTNYAQHHPKFNVDDDAMPVGIASLAAVACDYLAGAEEPEGE